MLTVKTKVEGDIIRLRLCLKYRKRYKRNKDNNEKYGKRGKQNNTDSFLKI